jgi:hypothetical protein
MDTKVQDIIVEYLLFLFGDGSKCIMRNLSCSNIMKYYMGIEDDDDDESKAN